MTFLCTIYPIFDHKILKISERTHNEWKVWVVHYGHCVYSSKID